MAENLRDMIVSIGFDVPRSPLSELNREMNRFTRNVTTASSSMSSFARANNGAIDESRAMTREVSRQTEFIRRLARTSGMAATHLADDWSSMSQEMRRSFIQNHNQLIQHRKDLVNVEHDMRRLGNQMGNYTGTTGDFMDEVQRLGRDHKKITDQMINSDMTLRQGFIQTVATMSAMSGQSEKISANYNRMGGALYGVNRPLLAVTNGLERMARNGNAAQLALQMLGPNASMKALMDQVRLINQGVMRQQAVVVAAGIAWLGFTAILAHAAMGPDPAEVRAEQEQLTQIYTKEWRKRVDEIGHFVGIFEKVSVPKVKPSDVMKAMQSQLKAMETWRKSLQSLTKKGVDEGLIKELQKAGPEAAYQVRAIDRMSKPELDKYVQTWRDKMSLARTQATDELSKLKKQTDNKIKELQDSIKPLGTAWENFKSTWATALKPFVEFWGQLAAGFIKIGTKIGEFVNYLNGINPWITKLAGMFLFLVATFTLLLSPLAVGIGLFGGMQAALAGVWPLISPIVVGLGAMMGTVLLVSSVVVGLGVALYLLWTRSETFRNGIIKGWNAIKSAAVSVFNFIKPYIMQAISAVTTFVGQKLTQLKAFWDQNGAMILQTAKNVWGVLSAVIGGAVKAIWAVMKFVWPFVLLLIKSVWGNIKGVINGALNIIMGLVKIFAGLFTGNFSKMWEGIKQMFFGAIQFVWNYINLMMFGRILSAGKLFFAGFKTIISTLWTTLKNLFMNGVKAAGRFVSSGFRAMHNSVSTFMNLIRDTVTTRFRNIIDAAKALPGKIGSGIKQMGGKALDGIKSFGKTIFGGFKKVVNGVIDGINWAMKGIGLNGMTIELWKPPEYAKGTKFHPGGLAVLGDGGGPELYRTPSGHVGLSPGKDTLMNLPKGTEVLPYKQSMELLNAGLPAYAKGAKGKGSDGNILSQAWEGTKSVAGTVKNAALDVWDYISDPSALTSKIFEKFGVEFPKITGAFYDIGVGSVKFLKDKTVGYLKKQLESLTLSFGGGNEGKDPSKVGPGSGYGGMMKYVEAVYNSVKSRFGTTRFMGGYNNRNVVGGSSKSMHAYGRAFDIGGSHETMSKIAEYLRTTASNLQYVIYNRRIAGPGMGKAWRKYTGLNPHTDHVHADFKAISGGVGGMKATGSVAKWIAAGMGRAGVSGSNWMNGLAWIINKESTNNPKSVGAPTSDGTAKGLMQLKDFNYKGDPFSPVNNIYWGIQYIKNRYKSIEGAMDWWKSHNWYKNGTKSHKGGLAVLGDGKKHELFRTPSGQMGLSPDFATLMNLPRGSQVLSGNETEQAFESFTSSSASGSGSRPTINFNPIINIDMGGNSGNSVDVKKAIQEALDEQWQRLISIYGIEVAR